MPKKRIEPRGLNRKIAKILGLKDTYISAVLNGKVGASDKRITQIAAAKEQARQEVEMDIKVRAAKKAAKLKLLQNA
jgi:DNA-binding transcriptional regulator YdaS (Cro superfamily)